MKTVVTIILALILSASASLIAQGRGSGQLAQDSTPVKSMDFVDDNPQSPVQKLEGTVEVSFKIRKDGTVEIVYISANNPELIKYVVSKLKKITLDPSDKEVGKTVKYRFFFKKQT